MHNKIEIHDYVFEFIYAMAINDAMNRVSNSGDKRNIKKQDKIREIVKKHAEEIINGSELPIITTVKKIMDENSKSEYKVEDLSFGKLQKLVNMTMKYLYVIYYDRFDIRRKFSNCDAPMDDAMRDFVYWSYKDRYNDPDEYKSTIGFSRYTAWSTLKIEDNGEEDKQYRAFQDAVKDIIKEKCHKEYPDKSPIDPIEFDLEFWDKSKELLGKKKDDQKKAVGKIWAEFDK